ncbi:MAG: pirin family protein [Pirellulaceae bacterium]
MIQLRRSAERGHLDHGWLDTFHTFSFGDYYDPQQMGFRALRVMNEDRVAPGRGFGMHGHRDMEIVTYVLAGALEHKDSMGNGEVLRPGEFQRMSAGTGIRHSEFNPSANEPVHLYQIWLLPRQAGLEPSYEQKRFDDEQLANRFRVVASPHAVDGSLTIQQDAVIYVARLDAGREAAHDIATGRHAWLQVLRGDVSFNGEHMTAGDGAAISEVSQLRVSAKRDAELMLFDMA